MTPDRDTLARDLLTLPALVGAPAEVVRGLCLVHPSGARMVVDGLFDPGVWDTSDGGTWSPAWLADKGWRVDLDAPATAGVLEALADAAGAGVGEVREGDLWRCDIYPGQWRAPTSGWGRTKAEARARALVEVARCPVCRVAAGATHRLDCPRFRGMEAPHER